jgi:HTH-like domain
MTAAAAMRLPRALLVLIKGGWPLSVDALRSARDARAERERADRELAEQIKRIHAESDGTYGRPRITAQLRGQGRIRTCASASGGRLRIIRKLSLEPTHTPHSCENTHIHRSLRVPGSSGRNVKFAPRTPPRRHSTERAVATIPLLYQTSTFA